MTRTRRLRPVVQHTAKKEQHALQQVARSQRLLEVEQMRRAQLQDYKLEYLHKKKYDIGLFTPLELQEFNRFMRQLDETIERQMVVVEMRQKELEEKRETWKTTHIDSKVIHKVVEKLKKQEFTEKERREQKAMDEFTQRNNSRQ